MPAAIYQFPTGFLWGTATASHQVEGNNENNNWSAWEKQPGRIIHGDNAGLACDWWGGLWKEDFDRIVETGQNAHRLSLEWSRIQPSPQKWDEDALDHYRQMIKGLLDRNIMPMVTLHHFSDPLWLTEMGGWENPEAAVYFEKYVRKVVDVLKDYVSLWCTINEPNVYTYSGYIDGTFPPGKSDIKAAAAVLHNLLTGHAAAYRTIHEIHARSRVGFAAHYRSFVASNTHSPLDRWVAGILSHIFNNTFLDTILQGKLNFVVTKASMPELKNTIDFIGLNYYTRDLVQFVLKPGDLFNRRYFPAGAKISETQFIANVPDGMTEAIEWARQANLPIIITENGIEDSSDRLRPQYLVEHLHKIWQATNSNIPIKGYFYWSLVDNFEWERGWSQRFGLWGLENTSQKRVRRNSVDLFQAICRENGISSENVEKYTPGIFNTLFPQ